VLIGLAALAMIAGTAALARSQAVAQPASAPVDPAPAPETA